MKGPGLRFSQLETLTGILFHNLWWKLPVSIDDLWYFYDHVLRVSDQGKQFGGYPRAFMEPLVQKFLFLVGRKFSNFKLENFYEIKIKKMNFSFHLNSLIINVVESWMNEWNENIPKWFFTFSKNIFLVPESTKESAKKRKVMGFEPWIMAHSDPSWLKSRTKEPQKQFRPLPNQTEPNFFLLVRHFYYSNAVNFCWLRWLIIVMNDFNSFRVQHYHFWCIVKILWYRLTIFVKISSKPGIRGPHLARIRLVERQ